MAVNSKRFVPSLASWPRGQLPVAGSPCCLHPCAPRSPQQGSLSPGKPSLSPSSPLSKGCSHLHNASVIFLVSAAWPLFRSGASARLFPEGQHCSPTSLCMGCRDANFHTLKIKCQDPHHDARQTAGKETGLDPFSTFTSASPHLLIHECQISLNLLSSIFRDFGLLFILYFHRLKAAITLLPSSTKLPKNYLICVTVLPFLLHSFTTR